MRVVLSPRLHVRVRIRGVRVVDVRGAALLLGCCWRRLLSSWLGLCLGLLRLDGLGLSLYRGLRLSLRLRLRLGLGL